MNQATQELATVSAAGNEVMLLGVVNVSVTVFLIILGIWYVLTAIGYSRLLPKTGLPAWHGWIPGLNIIDRYDIAWGRKPGIVSLICGIAATVIISYVQNAGRPVSLNMLLVVGYLALLFFCLFSILSMYKLALCFGKGGFYAVGLIFLEPLMLIILGYDRSWYRGKV